MGALPGSVLSFQLLDAAFTAFNLRFQEGMTAAQPKWSQIADLIPSSTKTQRYPFLDRLSGGLRKFASERVIERLSARAIEVENEEFERTYGIKRIDMQTDQFGIFGPAMRTLGFEAAMWPDDLVVAALQAGITTLTYDNQNFFDTNHPIDPDDSSSAVQSNNFTAHALTTDNYAAVRAAMMSIKGRDGKPFGVRPTHLVVPPALEQAARAVLKADIVATVVEAGKTAAAQSQVMKDTAELIVWERLAGEDTTWYLMDLSKPIKPFAFQQLTAPEFLNWNKPDDPSVFMRAEFLYGVYAAGAATPTLWQFAARGIA